MKYKEFQLLKKQFSNRVFSYKDWIHQSKNFSRKDFSKSWNKRVSFQDVIFVQTNFNNSRIENCRFINCFFQDCYINRTEFLNTEFINCQFEQVAFNHCIFNGVLFSGNTYSKVFCFSDNEDLPLNFKNEVIAIKINIDGNLQSSLNEALRNTYIKNSNTIFKKKKQHLTKAQKMSMNKINPNQARKMGLSKKQRLEVNRKRKEMKNIWQQRVHQEALEGKNRVLDNNMVHILVGIYGDETAKCLQYASNTISKPFNNISYLILIMKKCN